MKSLGVLGGFGPETTSEFYLGVVFGAQKKYDIRPLVLISNVPLPLEIERDLLATNQGIERYIPYLVTEAKRLEAAGADFLVLPCNSLHVFIEDIKKSVEIPVLSILETTVDYIKNKNYQKVGLISTSATVKNRIYETVFEKNDIQYVTPDGLDRAEMDKIIQHLVDGIHLDKDRQKILSVIDKMKKQKVDAVALACTDLQLLLPTDDDVEVFDTMKVLADRTIKMIVNEEEK